MFCVSLELRILFNTSVKNLLELSGRIDVQESFKLLKSKEAFCDNNNGARKINIKIKYVCILQKLA